MRKLKVGDKVRVHDGCGLASKKQGTVIVPQTDGRGIPTNCPGAYKPMTPDEFLILAEDGQRHILHKYQLELV